MSDPAKYIGWVLIRNPVIKKNLLKAVRPSLYFWQGLKAKSIYTKNLIDSSQTQPNILAEFRYFFKL
jgi:hypothetical protein